MTAIILAGGKSTRMGSDKAFIKIDGTPLINKQLIVLKRIFEKIIIVTNNPHKYQLKGIKIVRDIILGCGPLSGIYSGLSASSSLYNFVVACDMPFINPLLIKYMSRLKNSFDIIIPRIKKGYETLFAIYSKNCIAPIYEILHTDNLRVSELFDRVRLREINEKEIAKFGDPDILFMNVNTKRDLARMRKIEQGL